MQEGASPWLATDAAPRSTGDITAVSGSSFVSCSPDGSISPDRAQGWFAGDMRVLSRWRITIDGEQPEVLQARLVRPDTALLHLRPPPRMGHPTELLVSIERTVGEGMVDHLVFTNLTGQARDLTIRIEVDGDFADLFAVKDGRAQSTGPEQAGNGQAGRVWEDHVSIHASGVRSNGSGVLRGSHALAPHGTWEVTIALQPTGTRISFPSLHVRHRLPPPPISIRSAPNAPGWLAGWDLRPGLRDLAAMVIRDPRHPQDAVPAAGAPWFMALFGRDALLTSLMALPWDPGLAVGTLHTLARHQGTVSNPLTEEQPGRILHEARFGYGGSRYYGTADATPLFVMLLAQAWRFGALSMDALHELLPHADEALAWCAGPGDPDGDGFIECERSSERGLLNQGWRDSHDSTVFADGTLAEGPVALVEVQAYHIAALRARARIADDLGQRAKALTYRSRATRLAAAFDEAFWCADLGWYALGLDGRKRRIDALTSSNGHVLFSGVATRDRARTLSRLMVSPELFSGWGLRTLSRSMAAYNPLSYHNGSVWPHDTGIAAYGLARYGHRAAAMRLVGALMDASHSLGGRLPELFGGFDRRHDDLPLPYPNACLPQAWAAAVHVLVLRTVIGLEPDIPRGTVSLKPLLPREARPCEVHGLSLRGSPITLRIGRSNIPQPPELLDLDWNASCT